MPTQMKGSQQEMKQQVANPEEAKGGDLDLFKDFSRFATNIDDKFKKFEQQMGEYK
jgi:hypothetical protein